MQKTKTNTSRRAWNLIRVVLMWTRTGGVSRRKLMMDLRLFSKNLKSTLSHSKRRGAIPYKHPAYRERQMSFDKTPIIHVKMHRPSSMRFKMPHIPCINPQAEFDFEYDYECNNDNDVVSYCNEQEARMSFLLSAEEDTIECEGDEEIDLKADEFIANFYNQMKLQRQISYLQ